MIDINLSRERQTYSKMFNPKKSVADYVKKKDEKESDKIVIKSTEEKELEAELAEIQKEVNILVQTKIADFSFEVKGDWKTRYFPEISDIQNIVEKTIETYKILKKAGQFKEMALVKEKVKETMYAREHLKLVMNLDFDKPTEKLRDMAKTNNIDLNDPQTIEEFKKI
jgi:hypothetical protein